MIEDKITIMGEQYDVNMPKDFPIDDFNKWIELHKDHMNLYDDFFDMMSDFNAYLFMKYNKDLFVKMMVEESVVLFWLGVRNWFNRNIPILKEK